VAKIFELDFSCPAPLIDNQMLWKYANMQ